MILTGALFLERLWNNGWIKKVAFILIGIFMIYTSFLSIHSIFGNLLAYREGNRTMVGLLRTFEGVKKPLYYVHGSLGANMDFYAKYRDFPYEAWRDIDNEDSFKDLDKIKDREILLIIKDFNRDKILRWLAVRKIGISLLEEISLNEKYYLYRKNK
jgi:hypothetical protein